VPHYDNPAGRLHELLRQLSEQNRRDTVLAGWAEVLGVPEPDVVLHIGSIANLVRQIQESVDRVDDETLRAPVARLRDAWARPIFPPDHPFNGELKYVLPEPEALETLDLVSAQLHLVAAEGKVPDRDKLSELKEQLHDVVAEIRESDELPDDLRHALAARLIDVEKAIEHVHVGGPDAVRRAMQVVVGTVVSTPNPTKIAGTSSIQKLWAILAVLWVAFNAGPKIEDSIEAWPNIVHEITSGQIVGDPHPQQEPAPGNGAPKK
jgi:hypothetical protein